MASRGNFNSRLGFILASAGSAVGLGNIWKFPFEVGAGGGAAFLVIYLFFAFVLCFPVMTAELAIGRHTQSSPVGAFRKLGFSKWSGIGYLGLASGLLILSFYNVVAAWSFGYFFEMVVGNFEIGSHFSEYVSNWLKIGIYGIIFMSATAFIVSRGISHGIERAAKIMMPLLLSLIFGLIIYSLTLPNAMVGIQYYLLPDFSKVTGAVVYSALGQAFFSLSLGMGALITFGSYVKKETNLVSSAAIITFSDVCIAFLAGLMMFPLVAYLTKGDLAAINSISGEESFIFETLPAVFQSLGPVLGIVVGSIFFLLLSFAALTSTISLLEVPTAFLVDEKKIKRSKATWIVAGIIFLIGIPSMLGSGASEFFANFVKLPGSDSSLSFMSFVGVVGGSTFLSLGGFLISVFVAFIWRRKNFMDEVRVENETAVNGFLRQYVNFAIAYICPIILGIISLVTIFDSYLGISF
ncbi:sodium-dependent transporter [Aliikangiella coralliicola]|uniref:Sodium-dependent transporter n=1 Tax=Aliikangiella coralliicola TaxID=2592383 RepID=A0A545U002_9GAMM|nr:sodium-dependent transporter [Aliikangiella coralliicola]TQV82791.1 sodium-dependent transporter [Aliikangiella coralliicola]